MKILLQINSVVNSGSTGRIAEEIGQLVISYGWESHIAYARKSGTSKSRLIKIGNDFSIKLHGLKTRLLDRHGLGSRLATKKLISIISELNPDIIHLHNIHGYYLNIEVLFEYLAIKNTPIIWTFHDCWPLTGHCSYFDFVCCEKWKTLCYCCPQKTSYPASLGLDRSKNNFLLKKELFTSLSKMTIVPVSNWMGEIVKQSYFSKFPLKVINNGINTDVFHPMMDSAILEKFNLKNKFIILGVASVWSSRKGLKDFIKLSRELDINYQIILVGLNSSQLKSLPQNIIGISKTESVKELALFYSIADVFVNPTWEDNFPTTNLESLACGTPVITYRTGGSPEAINLQTGFVVEKGDVQGLVHAINTIKLNGKISYSSACQERVEKFYNKNDRYMDYLNLYNFVLNEINNV